MGAVKYLGRVPLEMLPTSNCICNAALTANTAKSVTPPANAKYVVFSNCPSDFYVRWDGGAAAIPTTDITDGSGSELRPVARELAAITTFSLISPDNCNVQMTYYG